MLTHLPFVSFFSILLSCTVQSQECVAKLNWSTANATMMLNGAPFVLKGVSYFGFETETFSPHGLWSRPLNAFLDFIKDNGFNAIRVPFSLQLLKDNPGNLNICGANADLCGLSALQLLDVFIDRAATRGLLIMLDNHRITPGGGISELWYNNEYPEATVISLWKGLMDRLKNNWNIFAIDLKNEPHDAATWGNSNPATDWNKAAERMINALGDFPGFFFVEGIEWGNRFENAAQHPINTGNASLQNRVVYSPHCYGPDVYDRPEFSDPNFPNNLQAIYQAKYGFLVASTGQPVSVGEWGGKAAPGSKDATWNSWYVSFLRDNCLTNTFYWCVNPNSGDTGGLLQDDWQTPIPHKLALVQQAQPNPTTFAVQNGQICVTHGEFPEAKCRFTPSSGGSSSQAPPGSSAKTTAKTAAPSSSAPSTGAVTTAKPSSSGPTKATPTTRPSSSGVAVTTKVDNSWQDGGAIVRQYTITIVNNTPNTVTSVTIKISGVTINQVWNLGVGTGAGVYKAPSWLSLSANGGSWSGAGLIAAGDSLTITVTAFQ